MTRYMGMRIAGMLAVVIVVGLALGGVTAAKKAKKKTTATAGCVKGTDAKIKKAQEAATKATNAAFAAALKKQGLAVASLPAQESRLHDGNDDYSNGDRARSHQLGDEFDDTVNGVSGTWVAGPIYWTGDARPPDQFEFVEDGAGNIYWLQRKPTAGAVTTFKVCDCEPYACGSGCPACGSTIEISYGPIPAGKKFKGAITVSYQEKAVVLHYAGVCTVNCPP